MRTLCVLSKYDYGFRERGLSPEYLYFYDILERNGYDVKLFDFLSLLSSCGKKRMNEMLIETVNSFKPDLMLTYLFRDEIEIETLETITNGGSTTTLGYFGDDEWRFDDFSSKYAKGFKWIVTADKQAVEKYRRIGCHNVIHKKTGANHYFFRKSGLPEMYNCTFVGGARLERVRLFNRLKKDGVSVKCWGTGWEMSFLDRIANRLLHSPKRMVAKSSRSRLTFEEMSSVFEQSRINLNFSRSYRGDRRQIKGRCFEVTCSGGFLLSEYIEGIEEYFVVDKEIVCFDSYSEMLDKIKFYLSHESERRQIAESGYRRTLSEHTAERRLHEVFKDIGAQGISSYVVSPHI